MTEPPEHAQKNISELLVAKASAHGTLLAGDRKAIRSIDFRTQVIEAGKDIVRQGERPDASVFVLSGMLARYHTLPSGERQYISYHIAGDMPDVQSLFLDVMDHSVCALTEVAVALLPHDQLCKLVLERPGVGFAFWRITLVDAAIFRQSITNNSARPPLARLAHFFCEQYYRAREARLVQGDQCSLPLSQEQLGQTIGMSLVSVNRALQRLRQEGLVQFRAGTLQVLRWADLSSIAGFDPLYLHVAKESELSRTPFGTRRR